MIKAAIIAFAVLAILIITYVTDSIVAAPIGAGLLFIAMLYGWLANRSASRANMRKAEEATHRQREERAHDSR